MLQTHDPYLIQAPLEIHHWLQEILKRQKLVRIVDIQTQKSFLTTLLELDFEGNLLLIDASEDANINQGLIKADKVLLTTHIEKVPIEMTIVNLHLSSNGGENFFYCSIPKAIRRIQRRASFRVTVPKVPPAICLAQLNNKTLEFIVDNMSTMGVALITPYSAKAFENNYDLKNSRLVLPEFGHLTVNLAIVRTEEIKRTNAIYQRLGCAFQGLDLQTERRLQHYIFSLQQIQAAKKKGIY